MVIFARRRRGDDASLEDAANDDGQETWPAETAEVAETLAAEPELSETSPTMTSDDVVEHIERSEGQDADTGYHQFDALLGGVYEVGHDLENIAERVMSLHARMPEFRTLLEELRRQELVSKQRTEQFEEYRSRCQHLEDRSSRQAETIEGLEVKLSAATRLRDKLKEDLIDLQADLDGARQSVGAFQERESAMRAELDTRGGRLTKLESELARRSAELGQYADSRNKLESALAQNQRDLSQAQSGLSDRDLKLEKVTKAHEMLVAEHRRSAEERSNLRHDLSQMESSLSEAKLRVERLKAENDGYIKRLAAEKYSMSKARDALMSELEAARTETESAQRALQAAANQTSALERERNESRQRLADIEGLVATGRSELRSANNSISELSLKYAADLLTLDQLRDENRELRNRLETMQAEQHRMYQLESQYKSAEKRNMELEAKLAEFVEQSKHDRRPTPVPPRSASDNPRTEQDRNTKREQLAKTIRESVTDGHSEPGTGPVTKH